MAEHYLHLGIFSDWVAAADTHNHIHPNAAPGAATRKLIREVLGFTNAPAVAQDVRSDRTPDRHVPCPRDDRDEQAQGRDRLELCSSIICSPGQG